MTAAVLLACQFSLKILDQVALIWDSPVTNTVQTFTYQELYDLVTKFAGVLKKHGVEKGDRVVICK
jgi:propionyl-CoA synthetase